MPDVGGIAGDPDEAPSRVHAHEERAGSVVAGGVEGIKVGTRAGKKFVDSVVPDDGDSVSLTVPGKGGVKITNKGGKKTVETIAAEA